MGTPDATRVAHARRWFRQLGYQPMQADGITAVATPAHPDTWDANWVQAGPGAGPAAVFAALDRHHAAGWQTVVTDALTPPAIEAALALAGFREAVTLVEMATAVVIPPATLLPVTLVPVGEDEWPRFVALVDADHREGKRTGEHSDTVAAGLTESMRRRRGACDYWLLVEDGVDVGYGMTAACPDGLGLIENLFTVPERRGRGLMSAFIVAAAARLRDGGCDALFLDAHVHDTPKRLYARLGFRPVALTRTWVRHIG